jgi:hypothetical protein
MHDQELLDQVGLAIGKAICRSLGQREDGICASAFWSEAQAAIDTVRAWDAARAVHVPITERSPPQALTIPRRFRGGLTEGRS